MKSIFSKILLLCTISLLFAGCEDDAAYYLGSDSDSGEKNENLYLSDGTVDLDEAGFLTIASGISCVLDGEIITNSSSSASQGAANSSSISKSDTKATIIGDIVDADDDYIITITLDRDDLTAEELAANTHTYTYAEIKESGATGIALMPGLYTIEAQSPDNASNAEWSAPTYYGKVEDQLIVKSETTTIDEITCKLSNIKTTVEFSADMYELFREDNPTDASKNLKATLTIGDGSMDFTRDIVSSDELHAAYFYAPAEENTLVINLFGEFNTAADGEEATYTDIAGWQQSIGGVMAGQWRKISLNVLYAHEGNATIEVKVETWVYDTVIDVDTKSFQITNDSNFGEVELDDEENEVTDLYSPTVTLENGLSFSTTFDITAALYDFDAETCSTSIKGSVTPTAGSEIASLMVEFSSDNETFTDLLSGEGYYKGRVDLYPTNDISEYVSVVADASYTSSVPYKITVKNDGMIKLANYEGVINAKIVAIDNLQRESYNTLAINVDRTGMPGVVLTPPTVEWEGGYSFDEVHEVYASNNIPIVINVTSKTGITKFQVNITGTALPEEELGSINLASEMDLITPATEKMSAMLVNLGFPVGDDVEGEKSLTIDITDFMPQLVAIAANNATATFELVVGDEGGTTSRSIQVIVSK